MQQKIIILDFGSQTTQLIGRRVRELDTFCEILPYNKYPEDDSDVIGVILSGSPYSVHDPEAFKADLSRFVGRLPVLGICYGAQFMAHQGGGKVEKTNTREYGRAHLQQFDAADPLFKGFTPSSQVWMSHGDTITAIPEGYRAIASTEDVHFAAYTAPAERRVWGVQFHPEVFHSTQGTQLLFQFGNGGIDKRGGTPALCGAADVNHEVLQELCSLQGMEYLGVELHCPNSLIFGCIGGEFYIIGRGNTLKAIRDGCDGVTMAHPHLGILLKSLEQGIRGIDCREMGATILARICLLNLAPKGVRDKLRTIADA